MALFNLFIQRSTNNSSEPYDRQLLIATFILMCIGMVIVASSSIPEGIALSADPFSFLKRQAFYLLLCLILLCAVVSIPMAHWYKHQGIILSLIFLGLIAVLLVGTEVNGAHRWLRLGPANIQPSEFAKPAIIFFLASYLYRRQKEVIDTIKGFMKPLIVLFAFSLLLLKQPDLGSIVVIIVIMMGMLFIANAKLISFIGIGAALLTAIIALIMTSSYRMERVFGFLDPWAEPFGRSYQLTQSLMAFGRGGWFGQGLGNSVQKLEYLPEAHTDFIMAILAEELGFIGVSLVLILEFYLVYKAFSIGKNALKQTFVFAGYVAIGIAIWFFFQTAVNIGAASGIAPTKGLTLPLVSYGGSSLITISLAIGLLLRIDYETRIATAETLIKKIKGSKKAKLKETVGEVDAQ
ncbi:cell division-specific peptidoglycan biosynthesis regulator FtsW [Psychromonas ingrahamii 37]|uniref:Probable peptidoglycan glycosyltransferase FtsW n=1 Tax=Psychromonas ingrahamii (strain DSM 17664 / CCUG 51855 / 37) TaxID=357804 RepID=A1SU18_PSYIN|nr:putative lipid II flippase FtsW [Psychromonas ingrahamii]ABM02983.1 cell division-specific peptidoglycan biosynthesis regulator FtsW [Psychromonas ingrahamii 37]